MLNIHTTIQELQQSFYKYDALLIQMSFSNQAMFNKNKEYSKETVSALALHSSVSCKVAGN